jgi:adenosylcobinamide-GDP ribazoletransferase
MLKSLILSFQFLTRLPININVDYNEKNICKSQLFYPFVGMVIGIISGGIYFAFSYINKDIASIFAVLSLILVTGGLHMDGLSDTCDGFFSAREREKILLIMKDSRVGSFGVIALILDILLKYILISNLNKNVLVILMLSCANSRLMILMLISYGKPARKDGMAVTEMKANKRKYSIICLITYAVFITFAFSPYYLIPLLVSFLASLLLAGKSYKIIGGLTGDVYGACNEICEIVSIAAFLVVLKWI